MQGGVHLKRPGCDGTVMVPILLTSVFTFCRASANITSTQHAPPQKESLSFFPPRAPCYHLPHPSPSHLLQPSSTPICPSLQNVMRHACRAEMEGGGREGLLLLTGKILLIKKKKKKKTSLVSVSEGFLLCGMDAG